jgi:beta-lactamase regulating signal transducer with metallopeptidase domain
MIAGFADGRGLALLVELFIKSSVVLAAAVLGFGLLRRSSAALRHFQLSIFLVGLALLPALAAFSPGWHASWLPDWTAWKSGSHSMAGAAAMRTERATTDDVMEPGAGLTALGLRADGRDTSPLGAGPSRFRTILSSVLPALWLAGLILILARLVAGLSGVRRITREGEALDNSAWRRLLQRFMSAVRLNRTVEIKSHPQVVVPLTWGFRRPVVLMPSGTSAWTEDARSSALFHELSHVKRGDFLVMLVVRLSLALFWFNPLFWIAYKMLKNEQEKACDELVLKAGIRPSTYADNLLSFIRSVRLTRSPLAVFPGVLGMFGRSQLRERLLVILGRKIAFKEVRMKTKVAVSVLAFLAVAFIGLARPRGASATPETGLIAPDTAAVSSAATVQETQSQEVQKASEKQKKQESQPAEPEEKEKKVRKEVKIIVEEKEPGTEPVEIIVIDGKTKKEIKLDGSALIVKKGEDGKTVLVSPEGKEIAVIGGEGARLEIKGGKVIVLDKEKDLHLLKEPKVFTVIEGDKKVSTVCEDDEEEGEKISTVIFSSKPHLEIVKEVEEPEHITIKHVDKGDGEIIIKKRQVTAEPHVSVQVEEKELKARLAETQALLKKIEEQRIAESTLAAQQESLKELEKSLQALEEELKKKEESLKAHQTQAAKDVDVDTDREKAPRAWTWVEETKPDEHGEPSTITISKDKEACSVVMTMKLKDNPKETYEKAVAKLKQGLPQGYKLEPKFVEESGMMIVKITGPRGTDEDLKKVEKLIEELNAELKK